MMTDTARPTSGAIVGAMLRNPLIVIVDLLFGFLIFSCIVNGATRAAVYTAAFLVMLKLAFFAFSMAFARFSGTLSGSVAISADDVPQRRRSILRTAGIVLVALGSLPVVALFFRLSFIPGLEAVRVLDYDLLVLLRSTAFNESKGLHLYMIEYALRAFLPIGVFFLLLSRSFIFFPALLWATLLAAGVMAKIYPIILIAPLMLYCLFARRYILSAVFTLFLLLILTIQITTTNPALKLPMLVVFDKSTRDYVLNRAQQPETAPQPEIAGEVPAETPTARNDPPPAPPTLAADNQARAKLQALEFAASETRTELPPAVQTIDPATERQAILLAQSSDGAEATNPSSGAPSFVARLWRRLDAVGGGVGRALYKSFEAIYIRVVLLPGEVMNQWFETIPAKQSYLGFCGYRVVALALGCQYIHSPRRVFEIVYADTYVKRGIIGNLNAPGFLMDYANLGLLGVMISAGMLGFIIALFSRIFAGNPAFLAVLVPYFALTTEAPISLILNSGGLGVAAILLLLMRRQIVTAEVPVPAKRDSLQRVDRPV